MTLIRRDSTLVFALWPFLVLVPRFEGVKAEKHLCVNKPAVPARQFVTELLQAPQGVGVTDKARARVLRNRASAERSRQRRLQRITQLESSNTELTTQLDLLTSGCADAAVKVENEALQNELGVLRHQLGSLTKLLTERLAARACRETTAKRIV